MRNAPMTHPSRRDAVATIAGLLFSAPAAARAQAGAALRVGTTPIDVASQAYYAADQGMFKQAGLTVEVSSFPSGAAIAPAVASGALDVGAANFVSLALAHERGLPFVMIAPAGMYSAKTPTNGVVVAKNSSLSSAKDLNGKIIAVDSLKNIGVIGVYAWMEKNGGNSASVHFIELAAGAVGAALAQGRIDAAQMAEPWLSLALSSTAKLIGRQFDAIAPEFCEGAWFCTSDYADAHPDVVKRFYAVMSQAARWANQNPQGAGKVLEKISKIPSTPPQYRTIYPERFDIATMQPLIDAAARYGVLKNTFPIGDLIAKPLQT